MIERRQFTGGIDADTVVDFIRPGDYLNARNCRVFRDEDGNGLAIKPVNGTIARGAPENTAPIKVIGSVTDDTKARVYYFLWHGSGTNDHTIFAWDRNENTIYRVLRSTHVVGGLNFSLQYPITSCQLIGDELLWTDNNNPPRRINVERGIKTNHSGYVSQDGTIPDPYQLNINQHDITVIRRPAFYPPVVAKVYDINVGVNRISELTFQFAFRYKYRDGQYSVLSHYSKALAQNADGEDYNRIDVTIPKSETIDNEIQAIEILSRKGESAPWYIVKTYDREKDLSLFNSHNDPASPALSFQFTNSSAGISVADSESYLLFHDVPLKSKALEIAQNRLFLGNNLRGYDWGSANLSLEVVSSVIDPAGEFYEIQWECNGGLTTGTAIVLRVAPSVAAGDLSGWYFLSYTGLPTIPNIYSVKPNTYLGSITSYPTFADLIPLLDPTCNNPAFQQALLLGTAQIISYEPGFKSDSFYKFGIVFYDMFDRTNGVSHEGVVYEVPSRITQPLYNRGIRWTLPSGSQPAAIPAWAVKYSIVRTKNLSMSWFATFNEGALKYAIKAVDGTYTATGDQYVSDEATDAIIVPLKNLITYGIGYVYSEGDAVRITQGSVIHELQVIGLQGDNLIVSPKNIGEFSSTLSNRRYIEIYRPIPSPDDAFYYEVGSTYEVLNPGASIRSYGTLSDIITGDSPKVVRSLTQYSGPIEVMNINDKYWSDWVQDVGRPRQQLFAKAKRYDTEIAWSGTYFAGTDVNDLNYFLSADVKSIDNVLGPIQKLVFTSRASEYGTVMVAIGETDCASMYLGRSELYNAQEGANVISSANIIGSVNILRGGFGTLNPESVVENDGDVYWFCAIKSAIVRYNRNGLLPISDYNFASPAKWLGDKIMLQNKTRDNYYVVAGFDEYNKEYLLTTPSDSSANFPLAYPTLPDGDEQLDVNQTSPTTFSVQLEAGEVYRVDVIKSAPNVISAVYLTDLYHGSVIGTLNSFQFVAATTGTVTITVSSFNGSAILDIYKQRVDPYKIVTNIPQTWAFCEPANKWRSTYSFTPDWFGRIGDVLVTFKNGVIYTHDNRTNVSSFHNVSWKSWISFPSNQPPTTVKRYQGISMETDVVPDYVHLRTELPHVQGTDLIKPEFSVLEGVPYGAFLKDALSPNSGGSNFTKQLRGDDMVGRYGKIMIEFNRLTDFAVRMVNIVFRISAGHKL